MKMKNVLRTKKCAMVCDCLRLMQPNRTDTEIITFLATEIDRRERVKKTLLPIYASRRATKQADAKKSVLTN